MRSAITAAPVGMPLPPASLPCTLLPTHLPRACLARRCPFLPRRAAAGVTKHKRTQRFEAHIWETKKQIYLGGFDSEELAAKSHGGQP